MGAEGDWDGYREYDKPERPVRIWTLRIGGIFSGTVARDGAYWIARLNSQGLGGYGTAEQAKAVVDYQVWIEATRAREGVRRVKARITVHPQSGKPVAVK